MTPLLNSSFWETCCWQRKKIKKYKFYLHKHRVNREQEKKLFLKNGGRESFSAEHLKFLIYLVGIHARSRRNKKDPLTCMMLSSETEQTTQGSLGFQLKSEILAVCPPWMKRSSGGPSSASSADCSSPILLRSHTWRRRSVPEEARIVSLWGDHWTC